MSQSVIRFLFRCRVQSDTHAGEKNALPDALGRAPDGAAHGDAAAGIDTDGADESLAKEAGGLLQRRRGHFCCELCVRRSTYDANVGWVEWE
jgi:hypothetical protein